MEVIISADVIYQDRLQDSFVHKELF